MKHDLNLYVVASEHVRGYRQRPRRACKAGHGQLGVGGTALPGSLVCEKRTVPGYI